VHGRGWKQKEWRKNNCPIGQIESRPSLNPPAQQVGPLSKFNIGHWPEIDRQLDLRLGKNEQKEQQASASSSKLIDAPKPRR